MKTAKLSLLILFFFFAIVVISSPATAAKNDLKIIKTLCKNKPFKVVSHKDYKKIAHRKNKPYIIVIKIVSRSKGNYGFTKEGYYISYNKRVKVGKKVTSYLIYNPKNNSHDDVLWVVDNGKYK